MLRIDLFLPDSEAPHSPSRECACCGARYPVKRMGMMLFAGGALEGEICPECVLAGPAGAAGKVRERIASADRSGQGTGEAKGRTSWVRRMERRARLLEVTPSFSLAARQAAVRETRERR